MAAPKLLLHAFNNPKKKRKNQICLCVFVDRLAFCSYKMTQKFVSLSAFNVVINKISKLEMQPFQELPYKMK